MSKALEDYKDKKRDIKFLRDEDKKRGRTRFVGTGALLSIDENSSLEKVELKGLEKKLSRFAGLQPEEYRDFKGVKYLAEGYDGHIALLSDTIHSALIDAHIFHRRLHL